MNNSIYKQALINTCAVPLKTRMHVQDCNASQFGIATLWGSKRPGRSSGSKTVSGPNDDSDMITLFNDESGFDL